MKNKSNLYGLLKKKSYPIQTLLSALPYSEKSHTVDKPYLSYQKKLFSSYYLFILLLYYFVFTLPKIPFNIIVCLTLFQCFS